MAVSIRPRFTPNDIANVIKQRKKRIEEAIILNLHKVGEQFVVRARDNDTYKDRTGNLRSSIGYIVLKNGRQVAQNFLSLGGKEGVKFAKLTVKEVAEKFPTGFVLICVAGMNYAAAVESKGYDVITGASILAATDLVIAMRRIKSKIS